MLPVLVSLLYFVGVQALSGNVNFAPTPSNSPPTTLLPDIPLPPSGPPPLLQRFKRQANATFESTKILVNETDTTTNVSLTSAAAVTNADMQASIGLCADALSLLAGTGPDPASNDLMKKISNALRTCQSLTYDQSTLKQLSPHIVRMKEAINKTKKCQEKALSAKPLSNLGGNMVWWSNGYTPTPQRVQNLFNTASQCIEQYC